MNTLTAVPILVLAVFAGIIVVLLVSRRRTKYLRNKYGPEYQRTVSEYGNRIKAERDLVRREERAHKFSLRPLSPATRDQYIQMWREDQARFVDNPTTAVSTADRLVTEVIHERGYPDAAFKERVEDISVDHPQVVENYRRARDIVLRQESGQATTEDLRRAMVLYRALFDELLETHE